MARAKAVLVTVPDPPATRPGPRPRPRRERRGARVPRRVYERRYRQTIRHVDLWSVLKVSICFYLCGLLVTLAAGVVLWWIASAAGMISNIEQFVGDLVNNNSFHFLSWEVLRTATLVGLVLVCLLIVLTLLAAAFYNLFAELLGGVEVTVVEEEHVAR